MYCCNPHGARSFPNALSVLSYLNKMHMACFPKAVPNLSSSDHCKVIVVDGCESFTICHQLRKDIIHLL